MVLHIIGNHKVVGAKMIPASARRLPCLSRPDHREGGTLQHACRHAYETDSVRKHEKQRHCTSNLLCSAFQVRHLQALLKDQRHAAKQKNQGLCWHLALRDIQYIHIAPFPHYGH